MLSSFAHKFQEKYFPVGLLYYNSPFRATKFWSQLYDNYYNCINPLFYATKVY